MANPVVGKELHLRGGREERQLQMRREGGSSLLFIDETCILNLNFIYLYIYPNLNIGCFISKLVPIYMKLINLKY